MAIGTLFGGSAESIGLYGNSAGNSVNPTVVNQTYFEWFIFITSSGTPATPTGGSWDFTSNTGTAPTGWSSFISGVPLNSLWFSVAFIDSRNPTATIVWSTPGLISSQSVYATAYADVFTGNGSTTAWTLTQDPVVVNNTDVSINGVTQIPGTDYTLSSTTLTTTTAAPLGASILVKYRQALPLSYYGAASNVQFTPVGTLTSTNVQSAIGEINIGLAASSGSSLVGYLPSGTSAVATTVQTKLLESVSVLDFGADPTGVADSGPAFVLACAAVAASGGTLNIPYGTYKNGRVEVHGTMNVEGNGATVQYLGVGQLVIGGSGSGTSCVPTPSLVQAGVPYPASTMFNLASNANGGATSITLTSASGITAGMFLVIAGNPSNASSTTNYIPQDFEFIKVASVAGNIVYTSSPLLDSYTTAGAVFYTPGLATNCNIRNLNVNTSIDAYQCEVRSSYNCSLRGINFIGRSGVFACTFSEDLVCDQIDILGQYGPMSTARGTVSATFSNVQWRVLSSPPIPQLEAFFVEESFKRVSLLNYVAYSGAFSVRAVDMATANRKGILTITNSVFDASTCTVGAYSPLYMGTSTGFDLLATNCRFKGVVVSNSLITNGGYSGRANAYPNITGNAFIWCSANLATDSLKFTACSFESSNAGPLWPTAIGGFNGTLLIDSNCTFVNLTAKVNIWTATLIGSTHAPSVQVQTTGYYSTNGKIITVWFDYQSVSTVGATGDVQITGLPFAASGSFGNVIGPCNTAGLGSVATTTWIAAGENKIRILNGTTWGYLPMVAGTGKFLTGSVTYVAA